MYVLCNPHNPVGRAHEPGELQAVVELAARHGVTVVSDEIHAPLVLPGARFTPLLTVPGAARVAVGVLSASKAWNLAGLKCAAVVTGSAEMAAAVAGLPPDSRWRVGHLGVLASVAALTDGEQWLDRLLVTLDRRRAQLGDLLRSGSRPCGGTSPRRRSWPGWTAPPSATATGRGSCSSTAAASALEPGLRFGRQGSGHVRLNYATSAEVLDEAVARMAAAASGHVIGHV